MVEAMDKPAEDDNEIKDQSIKIVNHLKGLINNVYQNKTQTKPFETAELIDDNTLKSVRDPEKEPAPPLQLLEETEPTKGIEVLTANGIRVVTSRPTSMLDNKVGITTWTSIAPVTTTTSTTTTTTTTTTPTTTTTTTTTPPRPLFGATLM